MNDFNNEKSDAMTGNDCKQCAYRYRPGMPFEKRGDTFNYKKWCSKLMKHVEQKDDGTWIKYIETRIDVHAGQSRLIPIDERNIIRVNDGFDHVYEMVPIKMPCKYFLPFVAILLLAKKLASIGHESWQAELPGK